MYAVDPEPVLNAEAADKFMKTLYDLTDNLPATYLIHTTTEDTVITRDL